MKIDAEKILEVCGSNNKYQILLLLVACACWFSLDFVALNMAVLIFYPPMECFNKLTNAYETCEEKNCCDEKYTKIKPDVTYNNIITDRDLYCEKLAVKFIAVVFTLGVLLGAYLSSKYADIYGRRAVCIVSLGLFTTFTLFFGLIPFIPVMFISVFFMGAGSSGGTMTAFVMVYEVIATSKRGVYGVLINSSYGLAGLFYYFIFQMTKQWLVMCGIAVFFGLTAILSLIFCFSESPRYLLSANKKKEFFRVMHKIASKNGRRNEFFKYLVEEVFTREQIFSLGDEIISKEKISYKELSLILKTINYKGSTDNSERSDDNPSPLVKLKRDEAKLDRLEDLEDGKAGNRKLSEGIETQKFVIPESEGGADLELVVNNNDPGMLALCKYKSIRWSFYSCSICWVFISYTYFGNSYDNKKNGSEVFVNGYIMFSAEFISYFITGAIMSIPFMGRVRTFGYAGAMTFVLGILYFFLKGHKPIDLLVLFAFRFGVTVMFTSMYTYSTEVYPTSIRSKGLGLNLTFARLATIIIALTIDYYNPYLIFAAMGMIVFILSFSMKETSGKPLMDQIEEILEENQIKKDNKLLRTMNEGNNKSIDEGQSETRKSN